MSDVPSTLLDSSESATLTQLETRIKAGLGSFIDVGEALSAIRDAKLYRADYGTFEDYCRERWKMSRPRAYQFIEAADVVSTVGDKSVITNESQARELAKVPPAARAAVIKRVRANTGGKLTAAAIREVVTPSTAAPPAPPVPSTGVPAETVAAVPSTVPDPVEAKGGWSLPRWGERLRTYLSHAIEGVAPEHRAEAKWHARQIAADLFAESAADPKPEPWGNKNVIPPLPEWVTAYSLSIGYPMNGNAWCDQYATKGWAVGKSKMKDWCAAVRNWKMNGWGLGTITLAKKQPDKPRDYSRF